MNPAAHAPTYGHPVAERLRQAAAAGDWTEVARGIGEAQGWSDRFFLVDAVSRWGPKVPGFLERWCEETPGDPLALTVRGAHAIEAAWLVRGGGWAKDVSGPQWKQFFSGLKKARRDLEAALERDRVDPTPAAYLVQIGRGSSDAALLESAFAEAVRRDPECRFAHWQKLQALTPRWDGTEESALEFARSAAADAPEGSPRHLLVVRAHIEHACWSDASPGVAEHLGEDHVRAEVRRAFERSLGSPRFVRDAMTVYDRSVLAFALAMSGEEEDARLAGALLEEAGGVTAEHPWEYLSPAQLAEAVPAADWTHVLRGLGAAAAGAVLATNSHPVALPLSGVLGAGALLSLFLFARSRKRAQRLGILRGHLLRLQGADAHLRQPER